MKSYCVIKLCTVLLLFLGGFDKFERVYVKKENKKLGKEGTVPRTKTQRRPNFLRGHKKNIINVNTWLEPTQNHKAGVDDFDLQDSERFLRNCNVNKRSDPNVK